MLYCFRHEARDVFRNAVHASEHDAVIFAGHGCTGAVHKLIHALDLSEPPVVFVGPCEHHSNLLPWREKGAKVCVTCSNTVHSFVMSSHRILCQEQQLFIQVQSKWISAPS
jgi:selenocysteine lyase/cysteine desulfurase